MSTCPVFSASSHSYYQIRPDQRQTRHSGQCHDVPKIVGERLESRLDTGGSLSCQTPQHRTSDQHTRCAERQRDQNVNPGTEAAVHQNRCPVADRGRHLTQRMSTGDRPVQLAAPVIGNDHTVCARIQALDCGVAPEDTLDEDRKAAQPLSQPIVSRSIVGSWAAAARPSVPVDRWRVILTR